MSARHAGMLLLLVSCWGAAGVQWRAQHTGPRSPALASPALLPYRYAKYSFLPQHLEVRLRLWLGQ